LDFGKIWVKEFVNWIFLDFGKIWVENLTLLERKDPKWLLSGRFGHLYGRLRDMDLYCTICRI